MRNWALSVLVFIVACGPFIRKNEGYCETDGNCAAGLVCNVTLHACQPPDGGSPPDPGGAPTLTGISPAIGGTMGGDMVTLTGTNFRDGMTVTFNGAPAIVRVVSPTQITATIPARPGDCGLATVVVQESATAMVQRADLFRYRLSNISFTPLTNPSGIDSNARALGVLKLNNDSFPDLILANSSTLTYTLSVGTANMTYPTPFNPNSTENYTDLIVGNVNNDDKQDVIFFNPAMARIKTLISDGAGGLGAATYSPLDTKASALVLGNFYESMPQLDLAFIDETAARMLIVAQNTGAGFSVMTTLVNTDDPRKLITADFNKDGKADIVTILNNTSKLRVFLGNGDGTFQPAADYMTDGGPVLLAAGDVNGDGILDLLTANSTASNLTVAVGQADGTFSTSQLAGFNLPSAQQLIAADLNCDELADLATFTLGATVLGLAVNSTVAGGGPAFAERLSLPVSDGTLRVLVTQLDGDAKPDLAILSVSGTTSVSLFRNTSM